LTGGAWIASFQPVNAAALIQLAVSAIAVALMTGLAALATRGRGAPPLDEAAARRLLADEFPGDRIEGLWLAADGKGAVARAGDRALVVARMGDGYVARKLAWRDAQAARVRDGRLRISFKEPGAPRAVLAFAAWPPQTVSNGEATA
jgi:hypothetical protein